MSVTPGKIAPLSGHDELLREIGWMRVALDDLEQSATKYTAASDVGEVDQEGADAVHRMAIVKGRAKVLGQVFRAYYGAGRRKHNLVVEDKARKAQAKADAEETRRVLRESNLNRMDPK